MADHEKDAANSGDEGEKKVTFNETTEEKDYTKDKELDEEVSKYLSDVESLNQNKDFTEKTDVQQETSNIARDQNKQTDVIKGEKDQQSSGTKSDDKFHTDNKELKDYDNRMDNQTDDYKTDSVPNNMTMNETTAVTKNKSNADKEHIALITPNSSTEHQSRFSSDHEMALDLQRDTGTDNYFTDANTEESGHSTSKNEDQKDYQTSKKSVDDVNDEDYIAKRVHEDHGQTDVTIITRSRSSLPRAIDILTDDEKRTSKTVKIDKTTTDKGEPFPLKSGYESDTDTETPSKRELETKKKDEQRKSEDEALADPSAQHIVTKKRKDSRDEHKEQDTLKQNNLDMGGSRKQETNRGYGSKTTGVSQSKAKYESSKNTQPTPTRTKTPISISATRTASPRVIAEQEKSKNPRMARSAGPFGRQAYYRNTSSVASTRSPSRWSRPRTCGYRAEERRRKEKEFFTAELQRLKKSLKTESSKIKKPKPKDHYPYVFTSLEPYYNTYTPQYLIQMPDTGYPEKQPPEAEMTTKEQRDRQQAEDNLMYTSRCTAIGLTDPWDSLHMDNSVLPKIETSEGRRRRMEKMNEPPKTPRSSTKKRPEAKLGSTRLPKFPVISLPNQDLATKELVYTDIPMLRDELVRNFSHKAGSREQVDYTRTRQDFYRMELDRITEMHKDSRGHMRAAYFAYLQNTPGSRKAVYECLKELNKKEPKPSPQAVA